MKYVTYVPVMWHVGMKSLIFSYLTQKILQVNNQDESLWNFCAYETYKFSTAISLCLSYLTILFSLGVLYIENINYNYNYFE